MICLPEKAIGFYLKHLLAGTKKIKQQGMHVIKSFPNPFFLFHRMQFLILCA